MLIFPLEVCKILKGGMNSSSKGVQNNCMVLLELTFGIGSLKAALILAYRYRTFRPLMLMKLSGNKNAISTLRGNWKYHTASLFLRGFDVEIICELH